jgi:hypothetical protein
VKILALLINLLGIPAILFTGISAIGVLAVLLYASATVALWGLAFFGFCYVLLPILLIIAEVNGWQEFKKRHYANSIIGYKWVLLDLSIMLFLYFALSVGLLKK